MELLYLNLAVFNEELLRYIHNSKYTFQGIETQKQLFWSVLDNHVHGSNLIDDNFDVNGLDTVARKIHEEYTMEGVFNPYFYANHVHFIEYVENQFKFFFFN